MATAVRLALERIALSDALYHNVGHTVMVTLLGTEILRGREIAQSLSPKDWLRALTTARQLFQTDLPRVPTDQVASYVAHVADRLHLDLETNTAAAADAVSTTTSDPRPTSPTQDASASRGAGRA